MLHVWPTDPPAPPIAAPPTASNEYKNSISIELQFQEMRQHITCTAQDIRFVDKSYSVFIPRFLHTTVKKFCSQNSFTANCTGSGGLINGAPKQVPGKQVPILSEFGRW